MNDEPVSVFDWVVTHFIVASPGLNLIMLLYWSFSSSTKISKQNYARSFLIFVPFIVISIGLLSAMAVPAFQKVREESVKSALVNFQSEENFKAGDSHSEYRTFISSDGRTMEAKIIGFEGNNVKIERIDGQSFLSKISLYSNIDIEYIYKIRSRLKGDQ